LAMAVTGISTQSIYYCVQHFKKLESLTLHGSHIDVNLIREGDLKASKIAVIDLNYCQLTPLFPILEGLTNLREFHVCSLRDGTLYAEKIVGIIANNPRITKLTLDLAYVNIKDFDWDRQLSVTCRNLVECTINPIPYINNITALIRNNPSLKKLKVTYKPLYKPYSYKKSDKESLEEDAMSEVVKSRPTMLFTLNSLTFPHPHFFDFNYY